MKPRSNILRFMPGRRWWWRRGMIAVVLLIATGAGLALSMQPALENIDRAKLAASDELILLPEMLSLHRDMRAQRELDIVMRAAVREHPELIDSPRRDGGYRLDIALNADGSVYRSAIAFYPGQRNGGSYYGRFDMNRIIPRAGPLVVGQRIARGESVGGVGIAPNLIETIYGFLPVNYDPSRAAERVEALVRAQHAELIQPYRDGMVNVLTVLLTENGGIARTHVARKNVEQIRDWWPPPDFSVLGLDAKQLGPNDTFTMSRDPPNTTTPAPFHIFPDRNKSEREDPILMVHYAWPRRAGEPEGGPPLSHVKLIPELQTPTITEQLATKYCPDALKPRDQLPGRCWIVFTREGRVLRSGMDETGEGRTFGSELIRSLNPDLNIAVIKSERVGIPPGDKHMQILLAWVDLDTGLAPR